MSEDQTGDDRTDTMQVEQRSVRCPDRVRDADLDRDEVPVQAAQLYGVPRKL